MDGYSDLDSSITMSLVLDVGFGGDSEEEMIQGFLRMMSDYVQKSRERIGSDVGVEMSLRWSWKGEAGRDSRQTQLTMDETDESARRRGGD